MKLYFKVLLWVLFLVANYYGVEYAFVGMTYPSDLTFVLGFVGIILLTLTDGLILMRVFKKYLPKEKL